MLSEPKTLALETPEQRELRRLRQELEYVSRQNHFECPGKQIPFRLHFGECRWDSYPQNPLLVYEALDFRPVPMRGTFHGPAGRAL